MIRDLEPGRAGMTTHCPEPPVWHGRWQDNSGKWWPRIDSCDEHADGLLNLRKIT
jgi:hypothetical protein